MRFPNVGTAGQECAGNRDRSAGDRGEHRAHFNRRGGLGPTADEDKQSSSRGLEFGFKAGDLALRLRQIAGDPIALRSRGQTASHLGVGNPLQLRLDTHGLPRIGQLHGKALNLKIDISDIGRQAPAGSLGVESRCGGVAPGGLGHREDTTKQIYLPAHIEIGAGGGAVAVVGEARDIDLRARGLCGVGFLGGALRIALGQEGDDGAPGGGSGLPQALGGGARIRTRGQGLLHQAAELGIAKLSPPGLKIGRLQSCPAFRRLEGSRQDDVRLARCCAGPERQAKETGYNKDDGAHGLFKSSAGDESQPSVADGVSAAQPRPWVLSFL